MLPSPIWPLAEHASFGQNWCDASIGSVVLFILHSMPLDACFFQALLTFSPVSGGLPVLGIAAYVYREDDEQHDRYEIRVKIPDIVRHTS
jgi:hypothetical protein